MSSRRERYGQTQVGIVTPEGRDFTALGTTVRGRDITAYTKRNGHRLAPTTWAGRTILPCWCEVVREYGAVIERIVPNAVCYRPSLGKGRLRPTRGTAAMSFRTRTVRGEQVRDNGTLTIR